MTAIETVNPLVVDFIKSGKSSLFGIKVLLWCFFWEVGGCLRFRLGRQLRFRGLNYMYESKWIFSEGLTVFPGDLTSA